MSEQVRILVVGPAWVGDMVMAQSLFKTLQSRYDKVLIDVVAPPWSLSLLRRMPEVNKAIVLTVKHGKPGLSARFAVGRSLRSTNYNQAIVLPRSFKAALVPFIARIPTRIGYRGEMRFGIINKRRRLDQQLLSQTVHRFVALGLEQEPQQVPVIPEPTLAIDKDNQQYLIKKLSLNISKPVIVFMPGAEYGPAKCWPITYYRQLAEMLVSHDYRIWVMGSEREVALGDKIVQADDRQIVNLCGKTRLEDVVDLFALANMAVTNDSGLMHIACATGIKVLAIYGSSSPGYTPPLSGKAEVVYLNKSCSPCFKRTCPFGHTDCLRDIKPVDVFKQIY